MWWVGDQEAVCLKKKLMIFPAAVMWSHLCTVLAVLVCRPLGQLGGTLSFTSKRGYEGKHHLPFLLLIRSVQFNNWFTFSSLVYLSLLHFAIAG